MTMVTYDQNCGLNYGCKSRTICTFLFHIFFSITFAISGETYKASFSLSMIQDTS